MTFLGDGFANAGPIVCGGRGTGVVGAAAVPTNPGRHRGQRLRQLHQEGVRDQVAEIRDVADRVRAGAGEARRGTTRQELGALGVISSRDRWKLYHRIPRLVENPDGSRPWCRGRCGIHGAGASGGRPLPLQTRGD